jgi:N-sulfoglucosamine sulfohydrolase
MRRRTALKALLSAFPLANAIARSARSRPIPPRPPNILWLTVEDLSPKLGCYGDALANTPNLDRLAAEGARFTNVFSTAPVCSPSRATLITGMYATSIGAHQHRANDDFPSFAHRPYLAVPPPYVKAFTEYLRAVGYYCTNNAKTDYQFAPHTDPRQPLTAWDDSSQTAHWRNRPRADQPFFAVFNSARTHESRVWPDPNEAPILDPAKVVLPPYYPDTPIIRRDYARHYDNVARMDQWTGGMLGQLDADGLGENAIVVFFSDHGDGLPRAKRWLYDSGLHVPMIIRWPGHLKPGSVNNDLISFVDFAPTLLSLAGVEIPTHMQGQAFLGPQKKAPRKYIFAARDRMDESHDMRRAVRDQRFKYIRNYFPDRPYVLPNEYRDRMPLMQELLRLNAEGKLTGPPALMFRRHKPAEELYDVQADPFEINNLADSPEYQDVLVKMQSTLEAWREETGDMGEIPETRLSGMMWPGGVQPQTAKPVITPSGGGLNRPVSVRISSSTEGASIAYTMEKGDAPHWLLYTGPIEVRGPATVRARAVRYGFKESEEAATVFGGGASER